MDNHRKHYHIHTNLKTLDCKRMSLCDHWSTKIYKLVWGKWILLPETFFKWKNWIYSLFWGEKKPIIATTERHLSGTGRDVWCFPLFWKKMKWKIFISCPKALPWNMKGICWMLKGNWNEVVCYNWFFISSFFPSLSLFSSVNLILSTTMPYVLLPKKEIYIILCC